MSGYQPRTPSTFASIVLFLLTLFQVPVASGVEDNVCDAERLATADPIRPYSARGGGEYCEGLFIGTTTAPFVLLSATFGRLAFNHDDSHIVVAIPRAPEAEHVHIRARSLRPGVFYQMDAATDPTQEFHWPTREVLVPENLEQGSIGILGFFDTDDGRVFTAVSAKGNALSQDLAASDIDKIAFFKFRTPSPLCYVDFRLFKEGQADRTWRTLRDHEVPEGEVITLPLKPGDIPPGGTLRLEVSGRKAESTGKGCANDEPSNGESSAAPRFASFHELVYLPKK